MKQINLLLAFFMLVYTQTIQAQALNDECNTAIHLNNVDNWCSAVAAFSNADGTASFPSNPPPAICIPQAEFHDIWFSFTAQANAVNITVIGNTSSGAGGTLNSPQFILYGGSCANLTELDCSSDNSNANIVESYITNLTIGQTYYIYIDGRDAAIGTFQVCINNFNEVPQPEQDCPTAVVLCDKSPFTVQSVVGFGTQEVGSNTCMMGESSSTWYTWTCDQSGSLSFTLTPNNPTDDLDFIVYELPDGIGDCSNKTILRCMASGENVGPGALDWTACTGPTGLSLSSTDLEETAGCQPGDDNFVAAIDMVSGTSYALVVNNFSNTGNGFAIDFSGTGTFLGPDGTFEILPTEDIACDTVTVTFDFNVTSLAGSILSWHWTFGTGATPATADTPGPHQVVYNSIGTKSISLVLETVEGCIVTEVIEVEVTACCENPDNIFIQLDESIDPVCAGDSTGVLFLSGGGGVPFYEFSLDGESYQGGGSFYFLPAGEYFIYMRDSKGCEDSIRATIYDPPPLTVDAGEDQTIVLGDNTNLFAVLSPAGSFLDTLYWSPTDSLSCTDCLDPNTDVTNNTTYNITVVNDAGCEASDSVSIFVNKIRPIYIPNAFSPNFDGNNDYFTLYGNVAAERIVELRIFNRWGAQVYEGRNLPLGVASSGWDGMFKGKVAQTGVYAFYAIVRFIDGVEILYEGDVSLLKALVD